MPFLFRTSTRFMIVDEKPRQGVFYQIYTKEGFLRPALIQPNNILTYTATLDAQENLHVIVHHTNHQATYYHSFDTSPSKRTVLEDPTNIYHFDHMSIQLFGEAPHLFYTIIHPNGTARCLVHQALNTPTPAATHLITNLPLNCKLSYYMIKDTLYILYPLYEDGYTLNCLTFTENDFYSTSLTRSNVPISDWNVCFHNQKLYILFTTDTYGQPSFHLMDTLSLKTLDVPIPITATSPTLLSYLNCLWIHYKDNHKLYTLLALPDQEILSMPVLSSLQLPATLYEYYSLDLETFSASQIYANLMSTLRLATLSALDTKAIHPDLPPNFELSLLLEGLALNTQPPTPEPTLTPPLPPKAHTPSSPTPLSETPLPSYSAPSTSSTIPSVKSLAQAAKDFMQTGNFFEP